jgi:hypothetical protein
LTQGTRLTKNRAPDRAAFFGKRFGDRKIGLRPGPTIGSLTLLILERETQAAALCDRNSPLGEAGH